MTDRVSAPPKRLGAAVSLGAALLAGPFPWLTPAQAIEVDGGIAASVIYSDNINLSPKGEEVDDWIGELRPNISITGDGARYNAWLDYTLQLLYYLDSADSTGVFHNGSTGLDLELLEDHFFLDSRASISQVLKDPEVNVNSSNIPFNSNRTDAVTLETTPRWEQDILGAEFVGSYKLGQISYDADDVQDVNYYYTDLRLNSEEKERGLGWGAEYEHRQYEYEFSPEQKRALGLLRLSWALGDGWEPYGTWGKESDVDDRTDASLEDTIWSLGLRRSTALTEFDAFGGERSFGTTWGALLQRQYGNDSGDIIRLSYREEPRTSEDISLIAPLPPEDNAPLPPPDISTPGSGEIFIEKRGELRISRTFSRNSVTLLGFYEKDERTLAEDETGPTESEQKGGSLIWQYTIGSRTALHTQFLVSFREFFDDDVPTEPDDDRLFWARLGVTYMLGQKTQVFFWGQHEEQSGSSQAGRNFEENQVGLTVTRSLF